MSKILKSISKGQFLPLIGLLVVYAGFALLAPSSFTSFRNLDLIMRQATIVGVVALGMTPIIISGGIDLSVGSVVALSSVVIAGALQMGMSPLVALLAGVATGVLCGVINGLLVSRLPFAPFLITLATLQVFRGTAIGLAHEQKIDAEWSWLNEMLVTLQPEQAWQIVPAGVWLFVLLALVITFILRRTRLGLHVFAVGSNEKAARLSGVEVERVKLSVYVLGGLLAGIGGLLQFSRLSVGDPTVGAQLELDAITAVVIGGASLFGGRGTVMGTVCGVLLMTVIRSGCVQMGVSNWTQLIITGGIILLAACLDAWRQKKLK